MRPFQHKILTYYEQHGRDLPWRKTTDRYAIMVSEIMLQQTQVDRVIPKYEEWLKAFKSPSALATAPLARVLELWSGLGYNSRAKRLQDACKIITEQYDGVVPDNHEELIKLPGIGPYTARSILIFADNQDLATVDTNIRRILIHELKLQENISDKELFKIAEEQLPKGRSRDWHNALMDYGATLLTARKSGIKPKAKQSPFKESRRYYRGQIIKHLTKNDALTPAQTKKLFPDCKHDLKIILEELCEEGLLQKQGKKFVIA
jgi:A/G-specific adenine glycosylase